MKYQRLDFLKDQQRITREHTLKLLVNTPFNLWYETPEVIETNIAWLTGHLIVSQYYHSIAVINGPNLEIFNEVPLLEYFPVYSMKTKSTKNDVHPEPEKLLADLDIINNYAIKQLSQLNDEDLDKPLEPTKMKHPIANTKYEALTWSFRHEMWHLGQISTLRRILGQPTSWD